MKRLLPLAVFFATACAASVRGGGEAPGPTLEVFNDGPSAVRLSVVYGVTSVGDTLGMPLGTVFAGKSACFHLESRPAPQAVRIHSLDGSFDTPSFVSVSQHAWRMDLTGHVATDRLSLEPADRQCR